MGEALAHLRYLAGIGALICASENGRDLYRTVSPPVAQR
jgi:hypothetical protein